MTSTEAKQRADLIPMIGCLMGVNALAVDVIIPALGLIQRDFSLADDNSRQLVVLLYVIALGVSQLFAGPLTDRFGRRPALLFCLVIYVMAGFFCQFAGSFSLLLAGRVAHGFAGGAIRVITISLVRDCYSGQRMARTMSLAAMILMTVPLFAPTVGQIILSGGGGWRSLFFCLALAGILILLWAGMRLPETLAVAARRPLHLRAIFSGYGNVLGNPLAFGYFVVNALVYGAIYAYVALAQQVYYQVYDTGAAFPLFFAGTGLALIAASFLNAKLVRHIGMRRMSHLALIAFTILSSGHAILYQGGSAPFGVFYALILSAFFCVGVMLPNMTAIAMEPFSRDSGYGAAMLGFFASVIGGLCGLAIGRSFSGHAASLIWGHAALGVAALLVLLLAERGRLGRADHIPTSTPP